MGIGSLDGFGTVEPGTCAGGSSERDQGSRDPAFF